MCGGKSPRLLEAQREAEVEEAWVAVCHTCIERLQYCAIWDGYAAYAILLIAADYVATTEKVTNRKLNAESRLFEVYPLRNREVDAEDISEVLLRHKCGVLCIGECLPCYPVAAAHE